MLEGMRGWNRGYERVLEGIRACDRGFDCVPEAMRGVCLRV